MSEQLQTAYWTHNASEQRELAARKGELPWKDQLRLHHLNCLELMQSDEGRSALQGENCNPKELSNEAAERVRATFTHLASPRSPYRPHTCVIWQGQGSPNVQRDPDLMGTAMNASVTHLGAIEVIPMDAADKPTSIEFVGISEVRSVLMGPPALFRAARISFDDERTPIIVRLPLLYGISWQSRHEHDRDGSITRFCCSQPIGASFGSLGIGIGHQDIRLHTDKDNATLMGLASVQEIQTPLDMRDPSFDQRCRARGIDPEQVRRQHRTGK